MYFVFCMFLKPFSVSKQHYQAVILEITGNLVKSEKIQLD